MQHPYLDDPRWVAGLNRSKSTKRADKIIRLLTTGPALREADVQRIITAAVAAPRLTDEVTR